MRSGLVPDRSWRAFDGKLPGCRRVCVSAVFAVEEFGVAGGRSCDCRRMTVPSGAAAHATSFASAASSAVTGSPGVWGPCATSSAQLAVAEINKRGGILGREIELSIYDAGGPIDEVVRSRRTGRCFRRSRRHRRARIPARCASRCATSSPATGFPTSTRPSTRAASGRRASIAIGETPRFQSRPSIHWLAEVKKASRWYLIGSDYVWPWQSHRAVKRYIAEAGGRVVGEEFVPLGEDNHEPHLARIRAAKPDVVLISLIGTDSITFNRAFGECGLGAARCGWPARWTRPCCSASAPTTARTCSAPPAISPASAPAPMTTSKAAIVRCSARTRRRSARSGNPVTRGLPSRSRGQPGRHACRSGRCSQRRATSSIAAPAVPSPSAMVTRRMPMYLAEADGLDFKLIKPI